MDGPSYDDAEVKLILQRAVEQEAERNTKLTHEELLAAASEIGISEDAVERAALDVERTRAASDRKRARRARLVRSWAVYATALGVAFALGGTGVDIPHGAIVGLSIWMLALSYRTARTLLRPQDSRHDERRARGRRRRAARREPRRRAPDSTQRDARLEERVDLLIQVLAASRARPARDEDEHVGAPRRVRVEAADGKPNEEEEEEEPAALPNQEDFG